MHQMIQLITTFYHETRELGLGFFKQKHGRGAVAMAAEQVNETLSKNIEQLQLYDEGMVDF